MSLRFSLAHLTALSLAPPELTYMAARAGYDAVSLRLIPLHTPGEPSYLPADTDMIRRTRQALRDTGLAFSDLELARILDDTDPRDYLPAMQVAAELGAKHVISSAWNSDRHGRGYQVDQFGALCDLARPLGLGVQLEYPTFSSIRSLAEAAGVVRAAGRPNGGILIDMLYVYYGRLDFAELGALPREWFQLVHLCDAPEGIPATREGQIEIARGARLAPGEGVIDVGGVLRALPPVALSIELPNTRRVAELGCEEHARRALVQTRRYLEAQLAPAPLAAAS